MDRHVDTDIIRKDFPEYVETLIDELLKPNMILPFYPNPKRKREEMFHLLEAIIPHFDYLAQTHKPSKNKILYKKLYLAIRLGMRKHVVLYNQNFSNHLDELIKDAFVFSNFDIKYFDRKTMFEIFYITIPNFKYILMESEFRSNTQLHDKIFLIVKLGKAENINVFETCAVDLDVIVDSLIVKALVPKLLEQNIKL